MTSTQPAPLPRPVPLAGATLFVAGADGGLGREFVAQALERGATRVYGATLEPRAWDDPRIVPVVVDVRDEASVIAAAATAGDATIVVNSAGVAVSEALLTGDLPAMRNVVETNLWGSLHIARAFAPALIARGRGTVLTVHSAAAWEHRMRSYSVSKAALWAADNAVRLELLPHGVRVVGLFLTYTNTPMITTLLPGMPGLNDPADVVRTAYDQYEDDALEILGDDLTKRIRSGLSSPLAHLYPELT
ncbi:SDR family NAD(P)-dependent oxidoreductase [Curtobacterium sp. L1-20]|uniref:SDR family NAD(P)-dependent oxidoreductase n=1 Tax=Curtobacterium sp. L1-20 TaxID=3138181 RepID=UPI003B51CF31